MNGLSGLFQARLRRAARARERYVPRQQRLADTAAAMRAQYLNCGSGCKARAAAIKRRLLEGR